MSDCQIVIEIDEHIKKMIDNAMLYTHQDFPSQVIDDVISAVRYGEPLDSVLNEIKAKIIDMRSKHNTGVLECLDIIDKYKIESEET